MLTERQTEVLKVWNESGQSPKQASEELGINIYNLQKNLFRIAMKGVKISPATFCEDLPAGWGMTKTTIQRRLNKETGELEVVGDWPRGAPLEENYEQIFEYIKSRVPISPVNFSKPCGVDPKIQLEWTLADIHYGMLAWRKETGEDYDIKIARNLILDSASDIFSRAGKVKQTVLVLMGDNFHTDFFDARTENSKRSLDVDTRFPKMTKTGVEAYMSAVEICLQYSEKVKVIVLYGNHDKQTSSSTLPLFLYAWFRNEPRVVIDEWFAKAHYNHWGCVSTVYHHGDGTTKQRLCGDFQNYMVKLGRPNVRQLYAKQAHLHKELIEDINGVTYEIVPSPVARDSFTVGGSYTAKRATVATMYHKEYGELDRYSITPQALKLKRENL